MTIAELGALGEFIASFGVIATLIYLAIQMRQNTRAVRLNTAQAVTEELQEMFSLLASDEGLSKVFLEAGQNELLSDLSRVRYYTFISNMIRIYENAFLQNRENATADAHWAGMTRMMIDVTAMPAFKDYWRNRKHWCSDEFQDYMDAEIVSAEAKRGINIPGRYSSDSKE